MHTPLSVGLIGLGLALAMWLIVVITYTGLARRYPLEQVAELRMTTAICDRRGEPLDLGAGPSAHATRQDIPEFFVKALYAREDVRFPTHHGIDHRGLLRATLRNLRDFDFTQGGSTLTMQLARNSFELRDPTNPGKLREVHRKLLEMAVARRIEKRYSKDEILTYYVNRIYFGSGCHGLAEAAGTYFGKPAAELSDAECALLVGIIRGPHLFSPLRNPEGALEQRRQTLERMAALGHLDAARLEELKAEPLKLASDKERRHRASHLRRAVLDELERCLDEQTASAASLRVITTIDRGWQLRLESELEKAVSRLENEKGWPHPSHADHRAGDTPAYLQYAAVTAETRTGGVLALIGGRNYAHSRYDRSHSKRDLGSAFEPFVAAAASQNDKLVIAGKPLQTGRQVGVGEVQRVARECGIGGPFTYDEDLYRGAVAASPREMAAGLATIANQGKRPRLHLIREIRTRSGELLYRAEPEFHQAIDRDAAHDAMAVIPSRSGTRAFTGATASERDAWVLRLGPSGSTAIWLGFDQPRKVAGESRLKALLDEFVSRLGNR